VALGLGSLVLQTFRAALRRRERPPADSGAGTGARELSTRLALGLLAHATLVTVGVSLRFALAASSVLGTVGVVWALLHAFLSRSRTHARPYRQALAAAALAIRPLVALGLTLIAGAALLSEPITDWDARSIWFFHAKVIHSAGGLAPDGGWFGPGVAWAHVHYPKLVPILAATQGLAVGYWNEILPKLGLVPLFACSALALLAGLTPRASFSALVLAIVAPLACGRLVYNGYVDGYLALAATGCLLATIRTIRTRESRDAEHALAMLGLCLTLKEDGLIFALALGGTVVLLAVVAASAGALADRRTAHADFLRALLARTRGVLRAILQRPLTLALGALSMAPWVLWSLRAKSWGLHGYLQLDAPAATRILTRLKTGQLPPILKAMWTPHSEFGLVTPALAGLAGCATLAVVAASFFRRPPDCASTVPFIVALAHAAALALIYLMTPYDLGWHLRTSVDRTMLLPALCLLVVLTDAMSRLEGRVST
jgi:hypothetical protein